MKLDLGGGQHPREGFQSVDIVALPGAIEFDLTSGQLWPWKDGEVEELSSSHFIEHIAADYVAVHRKDGLEVRRFLQDRLLFFFDEAFRVIKPLGLFHLVWPSLKSANAFRDPTHRRFLPLEFTYYLNAECRRQMGVDHYEATCNWVVTETRVGLAEVSEAVKPEVGPQWRDFHRQHFWNTEDHYLVTLRAEK